MSDTKKISSFEELLQYAADVHDGGRYLPVEICGDITFSLRIEGKSWDGRVDRRSAQYMLSLQDAFDNLAAEFDPECMKERPLVKMGVSEGSFWSSVDISSFLSSLVKNMSGAEPFWAFVVFIGAISGCYVWSRHKSSKDHEVSEIEKTKQIDSIVGIAQEAVHTLQTFADSNPQQYSRYERPIKALIKTMHKEDTISFNEFEDKIPAEDAKKCGPKRLPRSEEQTTYCDGEYIIRGDNLDEDEMIIELEQDGTPVKGRLDQMDEADKAAFIEAYAKRMMTERGSFTMNLQLNVVHTGRMLKYAMILGEGEPRPGKKCKKLVDVLPR